MNEFLIGAASALWLAVTYWLGNRNPHLQEALA